MEESLSISPDASEPAQRALEAYAAEINGANRTDEKQRLVREALGRGEDLQFTDALHLLSAAEAAEALRKGGMPVVERTFDFKKFKRYLKKANYPKRYPKYVSQYKRSLTRKAAEHFISFEILEPKKTDAWIDVAASSSPVYDLLRRSFKMRNVLRQDLNAVEKEGLLACNATEMPVAAASIDKLTAHNSWEHFEGEDDIGFIREAGRILKPGGRLAILPLDLAAQTTVLTSPAIWSSKYLLLRSIPSFDPRAHLHLHDGKQQRQEKFFSPQDLLDCLREFDGIFDTRVIHVTNLDEETVAGFDELVGSPAHFPDLILLLQRKSA